MLQTLEAAIGTSGDVCLIDPIYLPRSYRALATILKEPNTSETTLLSQQVLAHDWESPEEDAAWSHFQS